MPLTPLRDPVPAGYVLYPTPEGGTEWTPSCAFCATVVKLQWYPALFEGECLACGTVLSANVA